MFRRGRRTSSVARPIVQSFKKVLNFAPVSQAAGSRDIILVIGQDSVAAGQTGPIEPNVPTGSIVKFVDISLSFGQIVGGAVFAHCSIQLLHSGQTSIPSNIIGGNPQRNQVMHQFMYSIGINQNFNRTIKFKVPKKFQRIREGDFWVFEITSSNTLTQALQVIYKFYR